jgi:hypothetical protein
MHRELSIAHHYLRMPILDEEENGKEKYLKR